MKKMIIPKPRYAVKRLAFLVLAGIQLLMAGCGQDKTAASEDKVPKVGFIYETMTVQRWQRDRDIFVAKAGNLGAEVIVKTLMRTVTDREIGIEMINQGWMCS